MSGVRTAMSWGCRSGRRSNCWSRCSLRICSSRSGLWAQTMRMLSSGAAVPSGRERVWMSYCRRWRRPSESGSSAYTCRSVCSSLSVRALKKSRPCLPSEASRGWPVWLKSVSSGFCSICAGSMMLPQYSAAGLRAKMCTSLCWATACSSCRYMGASVAMPNTNSRSGSLAPGAESASSSLCHRATRCGAICLPSSRKRHSSACQISSSPRPIRRPFCQASIQSGR